MTRLSWSDACAVCGTPLAGGPGPGEKRGRGRPRKYCGPGCAAVAKLAAQKDRRREAGHPGELGTLLEKGRALGEESGR